MKKVLIVDDVFGWVNFHKTNLEYLNIEDLEIDTAQSAKDALQKVQNSIDNPYTTIFTDLQMEKDYIPERAGEWLVRQIKTFRQYENTKIVIISADPSISLIAKKHEVQYIPKQFIRNADAEVYRQYL